MNVQHSPSASPQQQCDSTKEPQDHLARRLRHSQGLPATLPTTTTTNSNHNNDLPSTSLVGLEQGRTVYSPWRRRRRGAAGGQQSFASFWQLSLHDAGADGSGNSQRQQQQPPLHNGARRRASSGVTQIIMVRYRDNSPPLNTGSSPLQHDEANKTLASVMMTPGQLAALFDRPGGSSGVCESVGNEHWCLLIAPPESSHHTITVDSQHPIDEDEGEREAVQQLSLPPLSGGAPRVTRRRKSKEATIAPLSPSPPVGGPRQRKRRSTIESNNNHNTTTTGGDSTSGGGGSLPTKPNGAPQHKPGRRKKINSDCDGVRCCGRWWWW